MHPAKSVIFFTTATGAGYGLLISLFAYAWLGEPSADERFMFASFAAAFALIIAGLLSSTLHLGRPERAWRAFSQWRSSWLSREGVAAVLTFLPAGGFAYGWWVLGQKALETLMLGGLATVFSLATIWCTGMIYASLKAVPAWYNPWTVPGYLALSAATGVPLLLVIGEAFDADIGRLAYFSAIGFVLFALVIKIFYWVFVKYGDTAGTSATATGLKEGRVTLLAAPHDAANYLMKEMGFRIARKHASRLRAICIVLGFVLPIAALVWAVESAPDQRLIPAALAFASASLGTVIERWLFFAEAKHVVTLYYGEEAV